MDKTIGDIYKNAEDKLLCLCLVQKDISKFTEELVRNTRPWLTEKSIKYTVEGLMKKGYEQYKKEGEQSRMSSIRKSLRNVLYRSLSRKCGCRLEVFGKTSENCKCETTCRDAFKANDVLQPFGRLVAVNRSFRLKLKHLDQIKYGHLDTEVPQKKLKLEAPEKDAMELAEFKPIRKERRLTYNVRYMGKSDGRPSISAEEVRPVKIETDNEVGPAETPRPSSLTEEIPIVKNEYDVETEPTKATCEEDVSMAEEVQEKSSKAKHSKNGCHKCGRSAKNVETIQYCKRHCPRCTKKLAKRHSFDDDVRSKQNRKSDLVGAAKRKRRSTMKFVVENFDVEVDSLQAGFGSLRLDTKDYYSDEWDFSGLLGEKEGRKRKLRPSSTVTMLEEIRQKHVEQLKDDLNSLQDHFNAIKLKHSI